LFFKKGATRKLCEKFISIFFEKYIPFEVILTLLFVSHANDFFFG